MKKVIPIILGLCVFVCGPGCGKNNSTGTNNPASKRFRIAFVTNTTNAFWATVRHGCNSAAQNLGDVAVDFRFFTGSTVELQNAVVSNLVAGGVDGLAISPIDAEKQTEFLDGIATKTLLVCVDSDVTKGKRASFIGSDNVAAGKQAADLIKAALPQGGKIVLCVGYTNAQNAIERIQAIQNGLAGTKTEIVATLEDATKTEVARKNAQDALVKFPDLAGLVGLYSYNGQEILAAVRAAGKAGKVKIVCFDDDSATLEGIASGEIYGSVVQVATRIGFETVYRMDKCLGGDKKQLSEGNILFKTIPVTQGLVESIQVYRQNLLQP